MKQTSFQQTKWAHRFSHGGTLRRSRAGRGASPLTTKEPIHLVFKTNRGLSGAGLRSARRFALTQTLLKKYARQFHVRLEQVSVQFDHIHLLVRITRRSLFQHFLRVLAGQIAQQFQTHRLGIRESTAMIGPVTDTPVNRNAGRSEKPLTLWKHRPFTRVVRGWKAYWVVRDYIQLNEKEATGEIRYTHERLRGLRAEDLARLWS